MGSYLLDTTSQALGLFIRSGPQISAKVKWQDNHFPDLRSNRLYTTL